MWSNPNLEGFKAVTSHFMERGANGEVIEASCMIAFRFVEGSHSGDHLGRILFAILKENDLLHKVCLRVYDVRVLAQFCDIQLGQITMDNASNCNTLMECLERLLMEHNIPFHADGNRIR